jgi:hypothetical protein
LIGMKKLITSHNLIVLAFTAVISLASAHLVDLGSQILGSGPASTPALIGDIAGLICCAISAAYGLRRVRGARAC